MRCVGVYQEATGGTKLVQGACSRWSRLRSLTVVVNTGDDIEWWGLHVSPDIDSGAVWAGRPAEQGSRMGR